MNMSNLLRVLAFCTNTRSNTHPLCFRNGLLVKGHFLSIALKYNNSAEDNCSASQWQFELGKQLFPQ